MPVTDAYRPDPRFQSLGGEFADPVTPAAFPRAIIRFRNHRASASVGLDQLTDEEWRAHFARFEPLPANQPKPLAMRYHGHQFRVYNPDLGDGRGFLFGQLRETPGGRLLDLGTKGSGTTPWSRGGDGRLTLKGGVREVLATAMLEALGVPTSRSFSLIETFEDLQRNDEPSPTRSAVLTRLSHSHIRFGSFQRHAALERPELIRILVGHVLDSYYPHLTGAADPAAGLLDAVVERAATLTARWMTAGFVHGFLFMGVGMMLFVRSAPAVPAAEMTILAQTETIFGPLWVWLAFGEVPLRTTMLGGGLILAAVVLKAASGVRKPPARVAD